MQLTDYPTRITAPSPCPIKAHYLDYTETHGHAVDITPCNRDLLHGPHHLLNPYHSPSGVGSLARMREEVLVCVDCNLVWDLNTERAMANTGLLPHTVAVPIGFVHYDGGGDRAYSAFSGPSRALYARNQRHRL